MKAFLPVLLILAASGCASTGSQRALVCDGKHRRAANPYGSVLPVVPLEGQTAGLAALVPSSPAAAAAAALKSAPPASAAQTSPPPPSAKPDPKSIQSCGGRS